MNKIEFELKNKCGIYIITNIVNGKRYIGSSKDLYNRLHEHLHNLKNNKGHNNYFQNSWNKHGEENFIFGILEFCEEKIRFEREQHYINSLLPEYNLSLNVLSTFGMSPSQETREKISNTLKEKYQSEEITTYRQDHSWIKAYIYDIIDLTLLEECDCLSDAGKLLLSKTSSMDAKRIKNWLIKKRYIITLEKFETRSKLINYINENILQYSGTISKYCIVKDNENIKYFRNLIDIPNFYGVSSKSTLSKHIDSTIDNPYIIYKTNLKFFFSDEFIPIKEDAVPVQECLGLLSTKNGEDCDVNTVVNN